MFRRATANLSCEGGPRAKSSLHDRAISEGIPMIDIICSIIENTACVKVGLLPACGGGIT